MKCLERNKTEFYYATFNGKVPVVDTDGYETGEYKLSYSTPILSKANISQSTGRANTDQFGIDISYDKILVTDNLSTDITEDSILWIGINPQIVSGQATVKHNYVVKRVALSLNSVSIALSRVDIK